MKWCNLFVSFFYLYSAFEVYFGDYNGAIMSALIAIGMKLEMIDLKIKTTDNDSNR